MARSAGPGVHLLAEEQWNCGGRHQLGALRGAALGGALLVGVSLWGGAPLVGFLLGGFVDFEGVIELLASRRRPVVGVDGSRGRAAARLRAVGGAGGGALVGGLLWGGEGGGEAVGVLELLLAGRRGDAFSVFEPAAECADRGGELLELDVGIWVRGIPEGEVFGR